jgi:hypothetical protein
VNPCLARDPESFGAKIFALVLDFSKRAARLPLSVFQCGFFGPRVQCPTWFSAQLRFSILLPPVSFCHKKNSCFVAALLTCSEVIFLTRRWNHFLGPSSYHRFSLLVSRARAHSWGLDFVLSFSICALDYVFVEFVSFTRAGSLPQLGFCRQVFSSPARSSALACAAVVRAVGFICLVFTCAGNPCLVRFGGFLGGALGGAR